MFITKINKNIMKIAVASDDGKIITGHVGKCEMFIVFDIVDKKITNVENRKNTFTMHKKDGNKNEEHNHQHLNHKKDGAGRHLGIIEGLKDCSYLFCCSGGPGLIDDLNANNIQTIFTDELDAEAAVKLFLDDKLVSDPDKQCKEHRH
jgi:predicted Fe-Mo cluster-binding NifX family protein